MSFIKTYLPALLLFSMIVTGFFIVPMSDGNIFKNYDYNYTDDMTSFDKSDDVAEQINALGCDLNPEQDGCEGKSSNLLTTGAEFISGMVQGAFGGLVSIYKSFGVTKVLFESIGETIGVPPFIVTTFVNIVLFMLLITILLIVFNRSDAA